MCKAAGPFTLRSIRWEKKEPVTSFWGFRAVDKHICKNEWTKNVVLNGQVSSVDKKAVEKGIQKLRKAPQSFEADLIYNMDETGFFRLLPRQSYVYKE